MKTEIGVIGMGVMGKSLSRNLAGNRFKLSILKFNGYSMLIFPGTIKF